MGSPCIEFLVMHLQEVLLLCSIACTWNVEAVRLHSRVKPILCQIFGSDIRGNPLEPKEYHDFCEVFAGDGRFSESLRAFGWTGISLDIKHSKNFDVLSPLGFCILLAAVWRIRRHGVLLMAPPCSSWIFLSMGSTGRRHEDYKGSGSHGVKSQTRLISRMACVMELCRRRKVRHIMEQPRSSLVFKHRRLQKARARNKRITDTQMLQGAWGHPTSPKDTILQSDVDLKELKRPMSDDDKAAIREARENGAEVSKAYLDKHGTKKCTGGRSEGCLTAGFVLGALGGASVDTAVSDVVRVEYMLC